MKRVDIYTDGACSGNPGPGGWAAVLMYKGYEKELSGGTESTTNNRMELLAAIEALQTLTEPCYVRLHSDSAYLCDAFNRRWLDSWRRNGWRTSKKEPVLNRDLWERLIELSEIHSIEFIKVAGHAGNEYNNRCDALARGAITAMKRQAAEIH